MNCAVTNQPEKPSWHFCAVRALLLCVGIAPLLASIGCRSTESQCRRETALMRAEILDIEDKYAALKSKYESNAIRLHELTGEPIDATVYSQQSNYHDVILNEQIIGDEIISSGNGMGEIVIEDGYSSGAPIFVYESGLPLTGPQTIVQPGIPMSSGQTLITPNMPSTSGEIIAPANGGTPTSPRISPDALPLPGDTKTQPNDSGEFRLQVPGLDRFRRSTPALSASTPTGAAAVTEIVINRSATRGQDVDGVLGDEGLNLMIQPKNANGRVILQPGDLSVSVVDPKLRKRIGFWRFLPEEVELFYVNDEIASEGILLHLPWDESTPRRARLLVHVEFVTADGRTLKTSSDVLIKPPTDGYSPNDPLVARWTQRDPRWGNDDADVSDDRWEQTIDSENVRFSRSKNGQARLASEPIEEFTTRSNPDQPKWRPVR
jgi:hypothetical protein